MPADAKKTKRRRDARGPVAEYWAVQRGVGAMPCLFGSRRAARENRDPDERLVRCRVEVLEVIRVR